jgi:hypothetical protein
MNHALGTGTPRRPSRLPQRPLLSRLLTPKSAFAAILTPFLAAADIAPFLGRRSAFLQPPMS